MADLVAVSALCGAAASAVAANFHAVGYLVDAKL